MKGGPLDFAVVAEALEARGDVVHFVVAVKRVFLDAQFVALALHDVDRIVQDPLDEEVAQLGHQHVRLGKMAQRDRQRADVVVVAMRDGDGVHLLVLDSLNCGKPGAAFAFGVHAGVHQQAVAFDFDEPGAGADVGVRIQIDDPHKFRWRQFATRRQHKCPRRFDQTNYGFSAGLFPACWA